MENKKTQRYGSPETVSPYAQEKEVAHQICAWRLWKLFGDKNMTEKIAENELQKLREEDGYAPEMERFADECTAYVRGMVSGLPAAPLIMVKKGVEFGRWVPGGSGVADCIMICGKDLYVIDFKYGKGIPVRAERNCRLALCALGAYREFGMAFSIANIHLHIVQPRRNNHTSCMVTANDLLLWGESVARMTAATGMTA